MTCISSAVGARISSCRRPRRSVWSTPHREGTLRTQRRCTFISQPAGTKPEVAGPAAPHSRLHPPALPGAQTVRFERGPGAPGSGRSSQRRLTGAFHALVHQPVEEGAAVVAKGGAAVAVQTELVLVPGVLQAERRRQGGQERGALAPWERSPLNSASSTLLSQSAAPPHSFTLQYLLSAYCVPGAAVNKQIKTLVPMQFTF